MQKVNKIGFTENEMDLIYDLMNGIWHDLTGSFWKLYIIGGISDAIYFYNLDTKWDVDKNVLSTKLSSLTDLKMLELLEMVMRFWGIEEESFTVSGTITFSEKREEILSQQKEA